MSLRLPPTTRRNVRHGWIRRFDLFHDLETNAKTQYRVHTWAQRFWIANIPMVLYLMIFQPKLWLVWGLFLTTLYSLYANWTSDNTGAAAARAVMNTTPPNAQLEREILHKRYDV